MSYRKICGWALTEREVGSNSTRLGTTFKWEGEGWVLDGNKRWIGNGVNDYLIVFGKTEGKGREEVVGALLEVGTKGISSEKIPNKYCFRVVQNAQVELKGVKVPPEAMLPGAASYKTGV
jgi:alkylation response protein AidB-like acyl-CoA dehydrogenase